MFAAIARFVLRRRLLVALSLLLPLAATVGGLLRLRADFSAEAFFGGDDPAREDLIAFEERWGRDDDVVQIVVTAEDDSDLRTPERLRAIDRLTRTIDDRPDTKRVISIATAPRLRGDTEGVIDLSPVIDSMPDGDLFAAWKDDLVRHPFFVPTLLADDGTAAAIVVQLDGDTDNLVWVRGVMDGLRAWLDEQRAEGLRFELAGIPAIRAGLIAAMFRDQTQLVPVSIVLMATLLWFTFRRAHGLFVPGVAAFTPSLMTLGLMGWTGEPVGLLNQAFFTLLPVLAISDAIHMVSRFHEELRSVVPVGSIPTPAQRHDAIVKSVEETGAACAFNSFTTAVGFLALQLASMPILRSFGLYASFGVAIMYLSVLVLVPLMLSLTNSPVPDGADEAGDSRADRLFLRIADFSVRHPYRVFAVAILLAVWGAWEGRDVIVDNELTGMLDEDDPGVAANRRVDETLGGVLPVELALEGPEGSMRDPAVLRALYSVEAPAKEGAARTVVGPAGYVAALNEVLTGRREIPATAAGVAQVMMLGEGEELDRVMDLPASHARVTFLCKDWGASELIPWMDDLQARADAALAGTSVTARLTGTPFIAYRGINNVTSDLTPSLGTAFVVIALVFAGLTRSLRAGFLAMIPNALPLLVGYGFMGFMGWYLDPSPAVMFTVALGIASDDTVHVTMRAREEVRRGASMADAMRRTIFHSGRACTVTSLILSAGFSLNGFSSFPGLQVMGGLACAILLAAMVAEVFLTPALFVVFGKGLWARGKV